MRVLLAASALIASSCHLFVDVPRGPDAAPRKLGRLDQLAFFVDNLAEVEPDLLYRSAAIHSRLLEFLGREHGLRTVINLRRENEDAEEHFASKVGGRVIHLPMSADEAPTPRQLLELIRHTLRAREEGTSILLHCRAGADRTSMMVGAWRQLFQGIEDREVLLGETRSHYHLPAAHPNVHQFIERFDASLFAPFIADPKLLDDEDAIRELETHFLGNRPLLSGRNRVTSGPLRAGVAKRSLLTDLSEPVQMGTYGPWPGASLGVRQDVFARALVLDNGSTRQAIVSCDLLISDIALREAVAVRLAASDLGIDDFVLAATHTHTSVGAYVEHWAFELYMLGPFDPSVRAKLADACFEAMREAVTALRPARLGLGRGSAPDIVSNRRRGTTIDGEVGVLVLTAENDSTEATEASEPFAVLVNFAGHPILAPADGQISSDYPGLLASDLDERYGFGIFLNGALGDLNAHPPGLPDTWKTPGHPRRVADRLLEVVETCIPNIETEHEVDLASLSIAVDLPAPNLPFVPDLLLPLDLALGATIDWRTTYPLQALRIGDAALICTASEIGCRVGRRIKRRSPSPWPFVVTHANDYAGYALTAVEHAKSKIDPSSIVAVNGPQHAARIEEAACDLLEALWGERLDPDAALLSPALRVQALDANQSGAAPLDDEQRIQAFSEIEKRDLLLHLDPSDSQSRSVFSRFDDTLLDDVHLTLTGGYLEQARSASRLEGRRRDIGFEVGARLPADLRIDLRGGHVRSDWSRRGGESGDHEAARDLELGLERTFTLLSSRSTGRALRLSPRILVTAPTGDADDRAPFRMTDAWGTWRLGGGAAAEFTWDTYHDLRLEGLFVSPVEGGLDRRPGNTFHAALRYAERHGCVSLHVGVVAEVWARDRRAGGRRASDTAETSASVGIAPGISIHLGDHLEIFAEGIAPIARSGEGGGFGRGANFGLRVSH